MAARRSVVLVCLVLVVVSPGRGDDRARKIVEKGIEAVGGEANLAKYQAATTRASYAVHNTVADTDRLIDGLATVARVLQL